MVFPPLKFASLTVKFKKQNEKVKLWIVQCGQHSATYFLPCSNICHILLLMTQ